MKGGKAVFLDRDGVLNRNVLNPATGAYESPLHVADFELLPGVLQALSRLQMASYSLILVSNQPNFAKGKTSLAVLQAIHDRLVDSLANAGISFSAFFYCHHHPDGVIPGYSGRCECRKPSPYFLFRAAEQYGLDLGRSWMIGDRETDVLCGRAAGVRTIRVASDHPTAQPVDQTIAEMTARDLSEAAILLSAADGRTLSRRMEGRPSADKFI